MKKFVILLCFAFLSCLLCSCGPKAVPESVEAINKNTTLDLQFLEDVSQKDLSAFNRLGGFGCDIYYNPKYVYNESDGSWGDKFVYYVVTAYPDHVDGGRVVTRIVCADSDVTFFGDNTVLDCEELFKYLSADGFEILATDDDPSSYISASGRDIVVNYARNKQISFAYEVSNREGIDF